MTHEQLDAIIDTLDTEGLKKACLRDGMKLNEYTTFTSMVKRLKDLHPDDAMRALDVCENEAAQMSELERALEQGQRVEVRTCTGVVCTIWLHTAALGAKWVRIMREGRTQDRIGPAWMSWECMDWLAGMLEWREVSNG